MKLITYMYNNKEHAGVLNSDEEYVYSFEAAGIQCDSINDYIIESQNNKNLISILKDFSCKNPKEVKDAVKISDITLCAPIPEPLKDIICLGINYTEHAKESARYKKEAFEKDRKTAIYFSKRVNKAVADGEEIPAHKDLVDSLDYEAELAVIIGKDALNVSIEDASEYIFGYTIINDVSARNVQTKHKQWYFGKSLEGFTPMGPCIVSADEISYPPCLDVKSYVNGELRQNSNTKLLITDISHMISELSSGMMLKAGTIISTGTPAGVGMGFVPPKFLEIGDVVECEIENIGRLKNIVGK